MVLGGNTAGQVCLVKLRTAAFDCMPHICHRSSAPCPQVFKALRGGVHPIAIREFRYQLSTEEQQHLLRLVSKLTRCSDPHVVKLLGFARIPGQRPHHSHCPNKQPQQRCLRTWSPRQLPARQASRTVRPSHMHCLLWVRPGPGYGFYIASNLFERGSLREALAAPPAPELLWYKRWVLGDRCPLWTRAPSLHVFI
jgi:hypothetical protein